jgi:hypothetical protein
MIDRQRIDELLALRAVEGLELREGRHLEALLEREPHLDTDGFDLAAAALDQALTPDEERLPAHLRDRVLSAARAAGLLDGAAPAPEIRSSATVAAEVVSLETRRQQTPKSTWAPWLAAAAAALLAIAGWWPRSPSPDTEQTIAATPSGMPSFEEKSPVDDFESAPDRLVRSWSATGDPTATDAGGEVVWSTARQAGFMRISGLAANDPSVEQYQLWIFDKAQDERYPIDGGVFDMPADGAEAVVPIDAKIGVEEPYLFAITVEKPGGVVVSSRERIALVAEV